jgi:ketosteroid isomerase-like protein
LEGFMSYRSMLAIAALLAIVIFANRAQETEQAKAERYIKESESKWAEAGVQGDTATVERILADDFVGVAPDGSFYDKAKEIADTRENGNMVSNHLNQVRVRFFGDTAVAQGSETWEKRTGVPNRGRYVWTDTWVRRNNKWQIVAAEDVSAREGAGK